MDEQNISAIIKGFRLLHWVILKLTLVGNRDVSKMAEMAKDKMANKNTDTANDGIEDGYDDCYDLIVKWRSLQRWRWKQSGHRKDQRTNQDYFHDRAVKLVNGFWRQRPWNLINSVYSLKTLTHNHFDSIKLNGTEVLSSWLIYLAEIHCLIYLHIYIHIYINMYSILFMIHYPIHLKWNTTH